MDDLFKSDKNKITPFKVPQGYFKELPIHINNRLERPSSFLGINWRFDYRIALSAIAILLMFSVVIWNFTPSDLNDPDMILADVPPQIIEEYFEVENFYNDEILALLDDDFLLNEDFMPNDFIIYEDEVEWQYYDITEDLDY